MLKVFTCFRFLEIGNREIYQYLDQVDYNCDRTISNIKFQKIPEFRSDVNIECEIENDIVGDVPK